MVYEHNALTLAISKGPALHDCCIALLTAGAKPHLALAWRNAIRIRVIMPAPIIIGRQLSAPAIMTLARAACSSVLLHTFAYMICSSSSSSTVYTVTSSSLKSSCSKRLFINSTNSELLKLSTTTPVMVSCIRRVSDGYREWRERMHGLRREGESGLRRN